MRFGIVSTSLSVLALRTVGAQVRGTSSAALHVVEVSGALNAVKLQPYGVDLIIRSNQVAGHECAPNPLAGANGKGTHSDRGIMK